MANTSLNIPYIVLSGTILIGVVLAIAIYQPTASESIELRRQVEADTVVLKDKQTKLRNIQNRVSALNSQREHEDKLNVVLPNDDSLDDVLRILHVAAQESGGVITTVTDQSSAVQSLLSSQRLRDEAGSIPHNITPLAFNISFTGTYRQLRVFLEKVEQAPRMMDVIELTVNKDGDGEALTTSMTIRFYKYGVEELNT